MIESPLIVFAAAIAFAAIPLVMTLGTSYVKVSIVLGLLRQGLGTQQAPSGLVVASLSLALSIFVMQPVFDGMWQAAASVDIAKFPGKKFEVIAADAAKIAAPWRAFLTRHAGAREVTVLAELQGTQVTASAIGPSFSVLLTAFLLTELKEAFCMGFVLLLPFLVIDVVVANLAVGLGLTMLNPSMVSLPLKLILFFYADGWLALSRGLIASYGGVPG